jgi:hypothetical protein
MIWSSVRRISAPLLLGVVVFVVQCRGVMTCFDSMWSVPTAVSLWDHGDANLDEYRDAIDARGQVFTEWNRGHVYTMFPLGTSLLVAPAIPLIRPIAAFIVRDPARLAALEGLQQGTRCRTIPGEPIVHLHSITELALASAIVATTTMVIYTIARLEGLSVPGSLVIGATFAFGTSAWSTASRALWQHGPSMLVLSLALLLQLRRRTLWLAGGLLAFAYVIRPTNSIPLALGTLWAVVTRSRRAIGFVAGVATVLALFVFANERVYGAILPPYYHAGRLGSPTFLEALAGDMVSPARGLLIFSPVLAFATFGVVLKIRARRFDALDRSLVCCVILHWVAIASFPHWWAGYSYGPRFFTDMLPYLVYFLTPVVAWLGSAQPARRVVVGALFAAATAFSVFVHAEGGLVSSSLLWNHLPRSVDEHPERIWDWRDPQFLAGVKR